MDEKTGKKRTPPISYRPPSGMEDEFQARVARSGLSQNGYITECIFGSKAPRASRRPVIDQRLVTQLLSQAVRLRDDLHRISLLAGTSPAVATLLKQANAELAVIRASCFKALGRKP